MPNMAQLTINKGRNKRKKADQPIRLLARNAHPRSNQINRQNSGER